MGRIFPLGRRGARLEWADDAKHWLASVAVSGRPATLDIVFASAQDRLDYTFDLPVGE